MTENVQPPLKEKSNIWFKPPAHPFSVSVLEGEGSLRKSSLLEKLPALEVFIHLLYDVQQAVEVMSVAAFSQVHQQLSGQFSDLMVFVLWDVSQLGDHHQVYQLFLQEDRPS